MLDGAMDGPHFLAYTEQILAPILKKGDLVSTHLVDGVEEARRTRFLPSPLQPGLQSYGQLRENLGRRPKHAVRTPLDIDEVHHPFNPKSFRILLTNP
jgi:hypothetical protein